MKKTSHSHHSSLSELNITPLLDLVFVLLVIFIITTPQMMNNLEMTLPSGKPPPKSKQPKPRINQIVVDARGRTFLNDELVSVAQLKDRLQQLQADNPDLSVVVKGADAVDYQNMIYVLDVLRQLDITKVGLATAGVASP
ncbi:MAG: biopolymer transporter ExbD [Verrucomicrobiota bacterium]